jgi:metal-responsive CopG/Arc/MetJ family transcriptional regulator
MNAQNISPITRVNITIPKDLIDELEKEVPNRGKSRFITKAIKEKLARERREKAFMEIHDAPSAFPHIKNTAKYVSQMRKKDDEIRNRKLHR